MRRYRLSGRVLDFGAGRGHLLHRLEQTFTGLTCAAHETAPDAAAHLAQRWPVHDELPPEAFDAIVCSEVLEHIEDDGEALDRMVAALAPGGRLYLTVPLRGELWTKVDAAVGHVRRYDAGALAAMCRRRGLVVEEDLATGFPFYNAYYRRLGRKTPEESAGAFDRSGAKLAARVVAALFTLEARLSTPWGGRGIVVAAKPA